MGGTVAKHVDKDHEVHLAAFALDRDFVGAVSEYKGTTCICTSITVAGGGPIAFYQAYVMPNRFTGALAISYFSSDVFKNAKPDMRVQILDGSYDPYRPDWGHPNNLLQSTDTPIADRMGDYIRLRPFGQVTEECSIWEATGYIFVGPGTTVGNPTNDVKLDNIIFGRGPLGSLCPLD